MVDQLAESVNFTAQAAFRQCSGEFGSPLQGVTRALREEGAEPIKTRVDTSLRPTGCHKPRVANVAQRSFPAPLRMPSMSFPEKSSAFQFFTSTPSPFAIPLLLEPDH